MASGAGGPSPRARTSVIIPPPAVQPGVEKLDSPAVITEDTKFPPPDFAKAITDKRKRQMPQCIAHRGFKAKFPENTILAFEKAVEAGARALETDVHLTKDDVVVLSHDATLKRCFGRKEKVLDCSWEEIKDLRTLAAPHAPMPRLSDLLECLARPGMEEIWLLLDIKLDNDADDIMRLIGTTVANARPAAKKAWNERVILGIWAANFLPLAAKYLSGFSVVHIGFKLGYARHFFEEGVPVGFNMLLPMMMAPGGRRFMRECREQYHRRLLGWTVNDAEKMEWCIRRKFDGVITDDPELFLEVCEKHDEYSKEPLIPVGFRSLVEILKIYFMVTFLFFLFRKKLRPNSSRALIQKVPNKRC